MRGMAVLAGAATAWVLAGGPLPTPPSWRPRFRPSLAGWSLAAGISCALLTLGLTGVPAVAFAAGALGTGTVPAVVVTRERRIRSEETASWPDFLAALRTELAGGRSLPEAFLSAGFRRGGSFTEMATHLAEITGRGGSFTEGLADIQERWRDPITDRVVLTLSTGHLAGGPRVVKVLAALGASIADELRLRAAHEAALTQQRLTAAVALVAPWGLLVLTVMTNPTASQAYQTASGAVVVGGGLIATVAGYLLALRIARLSRPPRVFR